MAGKERADQLLVNLGLAESREQAKRLIMAGQAFLLLDGQKIPLDKPGRMVSADAKAVIQGQDRFVSRGGYKLLTAIEHFDIRIDGAVCLDAGASTGGFTDCLLQHGAAKVYAVDVGYGQLHWKMRQDPRVVCIERVNLRQPPPDLIPEPVDLLTCDVSFISLTLVLPACMAFLKPDARLVALIKPQFEVGPGRTDKGVVRDEALRQEAVDTVTAFCTGRLGLDLIGITASAILGPKGNQEFLAYFKRLGGQVLLT